MIKFSKFKVYGIEEAVHGMRNPLNSWEKSDSCYIDGDYKVGVADMALMGRLARAGSDHRKYMRQVMVSVDITAPLYWWKQFDQYKVGVTTNSQSTMHCIHKNPFELKDFSFDFNKDSQITDVTTQEMVKLIIDYLNLLRDKFLETKEKGYWLEMIQLLPSSYNQTRTVTMTYETIINIYFSRYNHKLYEWRQLCKEIEELPYMSVIIESMKG